VFVTVCGGGGIAGGARLLEGEGLRDVEPGLPGSKERRDRLQLRPAGLHERHGPPGRAAARGGRGGVAGEGGLVGAGVAHVRDGAARAEQLRRGELEGLAADEIEEDVELGRVAACVLVAQRCSAAGVVDHLVGAEAPDEVEVARARCANDMEAEVLGELDCEVPDAARCREDEDALGGLGVYGVEGLPGGEGDERDAAGLV
jgi:hypothetical protein